MDDARFGRLVRVLRQRRGWRQSDLALRAGFGRTVVSDLERGQIDRTSLATVRHVVGAFGLSTELVVHGLGADLDRVLDARHAALLGASSKWLRGLGWATTVEVSYSEWGERGSVDLLCWHAQTATLLVVEIKTELASVEATLRKHDEKTRLGPRLARDRFDWRPQAVGRLLVFPDDRRERARVEAHASVLADAYPLRGYDARRWCRSPSGTMAGLLFLPAGGTRRSASKSQRERVRSPGGTGRA